jgi:PTS system mannose-specific IIA component
MIGLIIVTHCDLGRELLNAAKFIVGRIDAVETVAINQNSDSSELLKTIEKKIVTLNHGEGVLILTDMFGGTPSNLSLSFLKEEKIEVLTGVNLPMLIATVQTRTKLPLSELAEKAQEAGKMGISLAGKLLESG